MGKEFKPHIGIFGRRNNGKSSLINIIAQQDIAIVNEQAGTTTDPVRKSIEIKGIGPSVVIDTAGIDDAGDLGEKRVNKTKQVLQTIDVALLVVTGNQLSDFELDLIRDFNKHDIPFFFVHNKSDIIPLAPDFQQKLTSAYRTDVLEFSALHPVNREEIFRLMKKHIPESVYRRTSILGGLVNEGDVVLLITPIDIEAPEGRIILPQVQAIRDCLDSDCVAVVLKEREVDGFLRRTGIRPALAVTDSQVFLKANASIPGDIPLTSFSILMARFKGDFDNYLRGTPAISSLKDNDRVLMLESCTHQVSCDDIGRVKIPRWINAFTGRKLIFDVVSGLDNPPRPISEYALVIQCGGCVLTRRQLINRLRPAVEAGIPVTNYGMAIAYVQGIYSRAVAPFAGNMHDPSAYL